MPTNTEEQIRQIYQGVALLTSQSQIDLWNAIDGLRKATGELNTTLTEMRTEVRLKPRPCNDLTLMQQEVKSLVKDRDNTRGVRTGIWVHIVSSALTGIIAAMATAMVFWFKSGMPRA